MPNLFNKKQTAKKQTYVFPKAPFNVATANNLCKEIIGECNKKTVTLIDIEDAKAYILRYFHPLVGGLYHGIVDVEAGIIKMLTTEEVRYYLARAKEEIKKWYFNSDMIS